MNPDVIAIIRLLMTVVLPIAHNIKEQDITYFSPYLDSL